MQARGLPGSGARFGAGMMMGGSLLTADSSGVALDYIIRNLARGAESEVGAEMSFPRPELKLGLSNCQSTEICLAQMQLLLFRVLL